MSTGGKGATQIAGEQFEEQAINIPHLLTTLVEDSPSLFREGKKQLN